MLPDYLGNLQQTLHRLKRQKSQESNNMFSKLPNFLDKNFIMGYFLPIVVFLTATLFLLDKFNLLCIMNILNTVNQIGILIDATLLGMVAWILAVIFLGANKELLRLMEGYYFQFDIIKKIEKWRYNRL